MEVTFTKADDRRYRIAIEREHGPALVPRAGPGYDDLMPHDLAHWVVEEHFGIALGVWGQLAAGGGGIFSPAPEDNTLRQQRRVQRIGAAGRADMQRSERLVVTTVAAWERAIDRVRHRSPAVPADVDPDDLRRAVRRMEEAARRWAALPHGGALTLTWPRELTVDPGRSAAGRRAPRTGTSRRRPVSRGAGPRRAPSR